jgi:hypothetical protein
MTYENAFLIHTLIPRLSITAAVAIKIGVKCSDAKRNFQWTFTEDMLISWTNLGISLIFVAVVPEIVLYYRNRFKKRSKSSSDHLNEVMFFTDKGFECKEHCYNRLICMKNSCGYRNLRYNI